MDIVGKIRELQRKHKAVILAHNYQLPEIQDIADYTGDSLGLSIQAAKTSADIIVFCGVLFMAETAKILSPNKTVILPEPEAGCPMADMITAEQLRGLKKAHSGARVICYVNTSAEVKAESDICCTSANAVEILKKVSGENKEIIFVPDKFLASYAAKQAGCDVIIWPGYCPSHARILPHNILSQKKCYPQAKVIVHPECNAGVIELADEVLSTSGMLRYVQQSSAKEFIVGTEIGMLYALKKAAPFKKFYPASEIAVCPNMKRITLDKVVSCLETLSNKVELPLDIIETAQKSIQEMISQKGQPVALG